MLSKGRIASAPGVEGQEVRTSPSPFDCSKCGFPFTVSLLSLQRLYRSGDAESRHRYTLVPDHPDFTRARLNALHLSRRK